MLSFTYAKAHEQHPRLQLVIAIIGVNDSPVSGGLRRLQDDLYMYESNTYRLVVPYGIWRAIVHSYKIVNGLDLFPFVSIYISGCVNAFGPSGTSHKLEPFPGFFFLFFGRGA